MRARGVTAGLALLLAGITPCSLAACAGGDDKPAAPATSKAAAAPILHTLQGSVTVYLGGFVWDEGEGCWGYAEHAKLTGGADVVVRDAAGTVVAQGTLERGSTQMQTDDPSLAESCRYDFSVAGIPTGKQFYSVQVADVEPKQLTEAALSQRQDWTVE